MKPRILYIEDNEQNYYLVSVILAARGYEVLRASDGPEGIDLALRERPRLILLDIQLPGMDGYAVARAIKARDELRRAPIVAVTSYAMLGDREKALEAGCDDYVEKPIDPMAFGALVDRWLAAGATTGGT